jgi:hypothetical protein
MAEQAVPCVIFGRRPQWGVINQNVVNGWFLIMMENFTFFYDEIIRLRQPQMFV